MSEHTTTQCVLFPGILKRPVVAHFDQTQGSSDGGAVLLKAADRQLGLTAALAACLKDERQEGKVRHELDELLMQRVMAIACGYEDANDAARLASDPVHKLLVGRDPLQGEDLASQPTLSRFENGMEIGRTSCASFWANQFRVAMSAAAYVLMQELRLGLVGTASARAQVSTLRERFLKIGARVIASVRRIVLHLPQSFPYRHSFHRLALSLGAHTA